MVGIGVAEQTTDLAAIIEKIRPTLLASERVLPVSEVLRPLFPAGGIVRGSRLSISGSAAVSVCMASLAAASQAGSWVAIVGIGAWGWSAAARAGLSLERSVFVAEPPVGQWGTTIAALVDAVDVVVVDPTHQVSGVDARRLTARARERGSSVVSVAVDDGRRRFRWPTQADLALTVDNVRWAGLAQGHGTLGERVVRVTVDGRRGATRQRVLELSIDRQGAVTTDHALTTDRAVRSVEAGASVRHLRSVG